MPRELRESETHPRILPGLHKPYPAMHLAGTHLGVRNTRKPFCRGASSQILKLFSLVALFASNTPEQTIDTREWHLRTHAQGEPGTRVWLKLAWLRLDAALTAITRQYKPRDQN